MRAIWIAKAAIFVLTIVGVVILVVVFPEGIRATRGLVGLLGPVDVVVLLALGATYYALDFVRFYGLCRILGHRLRARVGVSLTMVSYFVSNLTPTAELNTPVTVFLLVRDGMRPADATAVSLTKTIYICTWILVISLGSLGLTDSVPLPPAMAGKVPLVVAPFLFLALCFFVIVVAPGPVRRFAMGRRDRSSRAWVAGFWGGVTHFSDSVAQLGRSLHVLHPVVHAASVVFIGVYVLVGWYLAGIAGYSLGPAQAITIFSTSLLIAYLAPVPGSIGVTEVSTAYLLDPSLSGNALAVATLLRVLCWYVPSLPGGLVLAWVVRSDGIERFRERWRASRER